MLHLVGREIFCFAAQSIRFQCSLNFVSEVRFLVVENNIVMAERRGENNVTDFGFVEQFLMCSNVYKSPSVLKCWDFH